ncbi:MAG: hypothetical protein IT379_30680, partial [Deltaproteobacteria bacterium]|nr:hypothetical protein [Deltaproteobacteria bacterium]
MLASTWFDLVLGIDIHYEMVPTPAPVPTPFPHPFVGLIFDPAWLAASIALTNLMGDSEGGTTKGPVLINSLPATNTGTQAKNALVLPHFVIPPGTAWTPMPKAPKPPIGGRTQPPDSPAAPPGDAICITGSDSVFVLGTNAVRLGDIALSCSDPFRLPTSIVLAIPKGNPVSIGGSLSLDVAAATAGLIRSKWVANELHGLVSRIKPQRLRNFFHKAVCFLTGHPVDVATGRLLTDAIDLRLPGPIPLVLERNYASSWADRDSPVGHGWSHSLDQALWLEPGKVVYRAADGREIELDTFDLPDHAMRAGDRLFDPVTRHEVRALGNHRWEVVTPEGLVHEMRPVAGGGDPEGMARLHRIRARHASDEERGGRGIELAYDERGRLAIARDCAGRTVRFSHDDSGKLVLVEIPDAEDPARHRPHLRYRYSPEGDLVAIEDALGHERRFEYVGHLMVKETDRMGLSFHFGYDGLGADAKCVRTWGDGGIFDHEIVYDAASRLTLVTTSLGHTTAYVTNVAGAVVKVIDPMGGKTTYEHDGKLRLVAETDPLGNVTRYAYDARGNRCRREGPDGAVVTTELDAEDRPVRMVDAAGGTWLWRYDARGRLVEKTAPTGERERHEYRDGLLVASVDPSGLRTEVDYDGHLNPIRLRTSHGAETTFERDLLGRATRIVDPRGGETTLHLDAVGNLVRAEEPDGNTRHYEWDAEGNLVASRDLRRGVRFTYTGFKRLESRSEAGDNVRFRWDTEGRLVAIENELGEVSTLEHDPCGRLVAWKGFDGRTRRYRRDAAGRVVGTQKPSGQSTELRLDAAGRVLEAKRDDGADRFTWRADGALLCATNETVAVRFERDALGRVTREWQGDEWVSSRWDAGGRRVQVESSLGAELAFLRDPTGEIAELFVAAAPSTELESGQAARNAYRGEWRLAVSRDVEGLEVERTLPGGVRVRWERDPAGRPTMRRVFRGRRQVDATKLTWEPDGRLAESVDGLDRRTRYMHDDRMRLARVSRSPAASEPTKRSKESAEQIEWRPSDAAGNVYRTADRRDRRYLAGGEIAEADGVRFVHDADGNLVEKTLPDGASWRYRWNAGGQLVSVQPPSAEEITFTYDALGRRVSKTWGAYETTWLWDGDVPLHELANDAPPTTWLFDAEAHSLLGMVRGKRRYGVVADSMGTPELVSDERGKFVWTMQLDAFGAPRELLPASVDCPWRWPGQYEDGETGLHYNRFRYYDPDLGQYLSQDPLGLLGGLSP